MHGMIDLVFRTQYFGSKVTRDLMRWWTCVRNKLIIPSPPKAPGAAHCSGGPCTTARKSDQQLMGAVGNGWPVALVSKLIKKIMRAMAWDDGKVESKKCK